MLVFMTDCTRTILPFSVFLHPPFLALPPSPSLVHARVYRRSRDPYVPLYICVYTYVYTYTISKRNKFPFYTVTYRLFKRKLKAENGIIIVVGHEGNLSVFSRKNRFLLHPRLPPSSLHPLSQTLVLAPSFPAIAFKLRTRDLRARFSPSPAETKTRVPPDALIEISLRRCVNLNFAAGRKAERSLRLNPLFLV